MNELIPVELSVQLHQALVKVLVAKESSTLQPLLEKIHGVEDLFGEAVVEACGTPRACVTPARAERQALPVSNARSRGRDACKEQGRGGSPSAQVLAAVERYSGDGRLASHSV